MLRPSVRSLATPLVAGLLGTLLMTAPAAPAHAQRSSDATAQEFERYRLDLDFNPIAPVVSKGRLRLSRPVPLVPAGFPSDKYTNYPTATYGLGDGWQVTGGITGAQRLGPGGHAIFYGGGIQKQLLAARKGGPDVSVGGYGMAGPHNQSSGRVYLTATQRLLGDGVQPGALYLTGGVKLDLFDGDDYGSGTGVRPFGALSAALTRRVFLTAEIAQPQPWEESIQYSLRGTYMFRVKGQSIGISGGIRNNGYRTLPFIGLAF